MSVIPRPQLVRLESKSPALVADAQWAAEARQHARMTPSTEPTELLLRRIRDGDADAKQQLYTRCLPLLLRWAHGRLPHYARSTSDTEDLVQLTLLRALKNSDRFESSGSGAFLAYLRQILLNEVRHEIRGKRRHGGEHLNVDDLSLADDTRSALELLVTEQRMQAYENALATLERRQQELIVLRIEFGLSWQEISQEVGASADSVRMMVTRAVQRMAEAIGDEH